MLTWERVAVESSCLYMYTGHSKAAFTLYARTTRGIRVRCPLKSNSIRADPPSWVDCGQPACLPLRVRPCVAFTLRA